ncbi:hypothetical protein VNO77_12377 [Canavalia gladiata]|uniref:Gnk2-homologous domain-containing protein n=1 Tax=Canavalia gladiata TaxID=3824 RepID=A0AAN9LWS3_CANGL
MHCGSFSPLLLSVLLCLTFLTHNAAATHISYPPPPYCNCSSRSTYAPNSTYHNNLQTLLSWLSSNATTTAQIYSTSVAESKTSSNTVYGLFMCRIDSGEPNCKDCVINSTKLITKLCPVAKEAILWADNCFMWYSNRYFFTTVEESPKLSFMNEQDYVGQVGHFNSILWDAMNDVRNRTANAPISSMKYYYKSVNITANQTLYALSWCIPYLSSENCSWCLSDAIAEIPTSCCRGKTGGRVIYPSCGVRYELYPFYHPSISRMPQLPNTLTPLHPLAPSVGNEVSVLESLWFDLGEIESATNKFAKENMIGKGGFGEVYKGVLSNGKEIAVKRLLGSSGQEYAMHGQFSVKSDVYSFGVMVLEIISGKRKGSSAESDRIDDIRKYALTKWRDQKLLELLDIELERSYSPNEVIRCIHVGLLCVRNEPNDRPTMAEVVSFLHNPSVELPLFSEQDIKMEDIMHKKGSDSKSDLNNESISHGFHPFVHKSPLSFPSPTKSLLIKLPQLTITALVTALLLPMASKHS